MTSDATINGVLAWLAPILSTLIICAGQLALNDRFKHADEKRDEARLETEMERKKDEEWRRRIEHRIELQDDRISTILSAQCTQMRSDIIHKCHRYLDDLGCASTEEKEALNAEHEDYSAICEANDIVNHFVDGLIERVMALPERKV